MKRRFSAKQRAWQRKFAEKYGHKRKSKIVTKKIKHRRSIVPYMARRRRSVTRSVTRSFSGGGLKGILNKVLIGLGAASLGSLVAPRIGVNPMIPSLAAGYVAGGAVGAIAAAAIPMLSNQFLGVGTTAPSGTVWV